MLSDAPFALHSNADASRYVQQTYIIAELRNYSRCLLVSKTIKASALDDGWAHRPSASLDDQCMLSKLSYKKCVMEWGKL